MWKIMTEGIKERGYIVVDCPSDLTTETFEKFNCVAVTDGESTKRHYVAELVYDDAENKIVVGNFLAETSDPSGEKYLTTINIMLNYIEFYVSVTYDRLVEEYIKLRAVARA